ncbi:MAG TPA: right-handed parallel beta-helix repeat-containing protein [Tenuifilaceae bacterium]|nr:right-handed parallel beta-helix repeat-containing protein [Tenuifilaceae bacterium]HPE18514.1 right-handed parallel beta-helix repeat-containing protein [Tenuifilaceae bacterium]HPJ46196.1 right-handed parallel beta-helix repeat-containing protein [Tenuifilaceae bacterium]HPQ34792.1 right-handed parallel beta-helix repeat-containing protein [Tenuifilaceae bacterium]HRX68129.1 right-handed parallel beta-helix repeat-containing protein [Tenuifilaceae bacterium]
MLLLTLAVLSANGAILIVNNNVNNPGNYTNLQDAIDAASPEDTILVSGSETYYYNDTPGDYITINKKLTLIGAGYNPYTQYRLASKLYGVYFTSDVDDPSQSTIMGFYINGNISVNGSGINYIQILRNRIIGSIFFNNGTYENWNHWTIRNNIIYEIWAQTTATSLTNSNFENNIITGRLYNLNSASIIFSNNLFKRYSASGEYFFSSLTYCQFINNIFLGGILSGVSNATFTNNIIYGYYGISLDCGVNDCTGNIVDSDPLFVDGGGIYSYFNYSYDYHLDTGSPGLSAGTDGTDIGIYGGLYPFPGGELVPWQTSAMPTLPQIYKMNVLNPTLPINGTLQVKIEATSQQ